MSYLPRLVAFFCFAIFLACREKRPIIVIDDWWNFDYVKSVCEMSDPKSPTCVDHLSQELSQFEREMITSFESDPICEGVVLSHFGKANPGNVAASTDKDDWTLMLDFQKGESSQSWSLVPKASSSLRGGRGKPGEIAHSMCAIAKHIGGFVPKP